MGWTNSNMAANKSSSSRLSLFTFNRSHRRPPTTDFSPPADNMSAVKVDSSTTPIDCVDESNDVLPPPSPTIETHEEENDGVVAHEEENDEVRISKANLRSPVWLHFDKVNANGEEKAICIYCNKRLAGASKNGTSHLVDHYKFCRRRKVADLR
ncbi:hypothetical protein RHMOL_Rhmol09G0081400 [Rhododendron molle]|uniref:Uncharacterized protein n=1 Tax=Rhododendron molle TaxID=49168 RepID=A0ACC0MC83_RHOML|nr:hypothetical protein RHMOL_Rhmol09G0081400 [Rhododendron molle]